SITIYLDDPIGFDLLEKLDELIRVDAGNAKDIAGSG
ncbi:MAG: hypothetical protein QOG95_1441, partial [Mycobacterium sp.]|nr:hypothetical protein [Mycobacterium sp.]